MRTARNGMNNVKIYRLLIFIIIGTIYLLVCFHRVSPTVIAKDLAEAFHAGPVMVGFIASAYFYLYSASQPFVGVLADTIGPRKVITFCTLIAATGSLIFGMAPNASVAVLGRALIGMGVAGVFIPGLKIFANWYRPDEFTTLTGMMIAISGLGYFVAAVPLAYSVSLFGWRHSHTGVALISILLAALCWSIVRDRPEERNLPLVNPVVETPRHMPSSDRPARKEPFAERFAQIFRQRDLWILFCIMLLTGGVSFAFQGLWAVPYLMDVHGLSRIKAGELLVLIPLGYFVSAPLVGVLADRFSIPKRTLLFCTIGLGLITWVTFLLQSRTSSYLYLMPSFFMFGLYMGGNLPLFFGLIKDVVPSNILGTAMGIVNPSSFIGAIIYQPLSGLLLGMYGKSVLGCYPVNAYQSLFLVFLLSHIISFGAVQMISKPGLLPKN